MASFMPVKHTVAGFQTNLIPNHSSVLDVQEVYSPLLLLCLQAPFCPGQFPSTYSEQHVPNLQL